MMIAIYNTKAEAGLVNMQAPTDGCWVHVTNPTEKDIKRLNAMGVSKDTISAALDMDERPRTERENGTLFIILRVPYTKGLEADVPYITIPLGIILTERYLITICAQELAILDDFAAGRVPGLDTPKRHRFVLLILLNTAKRYLAYLRQINKAVDELEDQLQLSTRNKEVLALLKYQKSLTYFTTALKANELMMERIQRSQDFLAYPDDQDLLEDVLIENRQAIEMTNIASNILSNMMDAFASIISNNLNAVMKFLASVTIILSLPTMVASFYGMNVDLPLQNSPGAFLFTIALSSLVSLVAVIIFYKRDWL